MTPIIKMRVFAALLVIVAECGYSQGFINLNFESANASGYSPGGIPAQNAFPGWSAYYGSLSDPTHSGSLSGVFYDGVSTGGAVVTLVDSNAPSGGAPLPLQGNDSALLEGSIPAAATTASLGQTGTIPSNAESLILWANVSGSLDVSFNGQMLSVVDVSNAMNYTVYAANISAYAGQTGQLLFTAPVQTETEFDNIQFSTSAVPEPSTLGFCAFGGLLFAWRNRNKSSA